MNIGKENKQYYVFSNVSTEVSLTTKNNLCPTIYMSQDM